MKSLNVLIVDDEPGIRNRFSDEFCNSETIKIVTAGSVEEATAVIRSTFLNVALVDMQLDIASKVAGGMRVFRFLADERSSCKVLLFTQYPGEYRKQLFALLDPLRPQIQGAVDKHDFSQDSFAVIRQFGDDWLKAPIDVIGKGEVASRLVAKSGTRGRLVETSEDEVDYVVSRLFGQSFDQAGRGSPFDMATVTLDPLTGGRSTSVVVRAQPRNAAGQMGIWCVIKFSPRSDAREEYERYCRYVRFIVSLSYRVELLGFVEGDTIGAMCYSFAGKSPESVMGLDELFVAQSDAALIVLEKLFDAEARFWYGVSGPSDRTLANYFYKSYRLEPTDILENIRRLTERIVARLPGSRVADGDLLIDGNKILSPSRAVGSPVMLARCKMSIVHGDMNAGNVVCSDDGRAILIDYRHTAFGPRVVDFAALECSLRLCLANEEDLSLIVRQHPDEAAVWKTIWNSRTSSISRTVPFWMRVSSEIARHARSNFEDLAETEYAATCFLVGLRVSRVVGLTDSQRLRLLVWMSQLTKIVMASR